MIANKDGGASTRPTGNDVRRAAPVPGAFDATEAVDVEAALASASRWLLDRQKSDGHWLGELEGDTILESEYVLLMAFLGRESEAVCVKACRYVRDLQLPGGGWSIYPDGPADVSA